MGQSCSIRHYKIYVVPVNKEAAGLASAKQLFNQLIGGDARRWIPTFLILVSLQENTICKYEYTLYNITNGKKYAGFLFLRYH